MSEYFESLADILSPKIIEKIREAELDAIHRGAGKYDEPVLKHGIRTAIELVRAEAVAAETAQREAKHKQLSDHYRSLEKSLRESLEGARQDVYATSGHQLRVAGNLAKYVSHHRAKGSKLVRLEDLLTIMGWDAKDWHHEGESRAALDGFGNRIDYTTTEEN
jgi:hypothetical protein